MTVDAGRFRRAKEVFLAASRREGADRERYLAETCGDDADLRADVERLLDADGRPSRLLDADAVPERIGEFRILGRLGAGGMGTVYEAEQQSPRRRVALKVLAPFLAGEEARRRFGYEAEILGRLEHPGIARVFAAGVEEGRPWFAMELVDGEPVTRYVRTRRLGARERLELVVRVCAAVQHAHQKGVVHRDLKPANILVDRDGQPKLLDFGVAKLTDAETRVTSLATRTGQLLGTIPYMSPEQVSVDAARIDLRTDVYALGVLAFELLSGRHPLDMEGKLLAQAILAVRDEEPPRLGTLDGTWRADIERHLRDEPVVARPPTTGYQLRKFARRNRVLVGGIVAVFAVLVTGIVVSMGYSLEAAAERAAAVEAGERERERAAEATRRTATASAALDFMVDLFEAGHPDARGGPALTTREMVERGAERVETRLRDQPELRSTLLYRIGRIFFALGEHERARAMYEGALAAAAESDAGDPEIPVAVRCHLAAMLEGQRRHDEAAPLRQEALAIARTGVAGAAALAGALRGMADHLVWRNRLAEAEALFREVLAHEAERLADAAPVLIGAHLGLARVMRRTRRLDEALRHGEKAVSLARRLHGDQHPQVAIALTPQAHTLAEAGRHADAVRLLREVRGMRLLWGGEDSAGIGEIDYYLGEALRKLGETGEALACHRRSFAIAQRTFKPDDPRLLIALSGLLEARLAAGDLDGLEAAAAKLVERQYALVGPAARRTGMYVLLLGRAVLAGQEPERAAPVFAKAATLLADTVGPHSQQAVAARVMRTRALIAAGAWTEALSAAREAMAGQEDAETREAAHAAYDLGRVLRETDDGGEPAEAETLLRRALELYRRHGAAADARRAEQLLAAPVK